MKKKLDLNQLAKSIVEQATGEIEKKQPPHKKNSAAVELGRLGGKVRSELPPEKRQEIAKKSASTRAKESEGEVFSLPKVVAKKSIIP